MVKPNGNQRISKVNTYLNVVCARLIIQAGIANVILRIGEKEEEYLLIPAKELKWHN